ncbi:putative membrane protein [Candidatus Nitrosacidococcus tergens]|uniref:Putative membrane protein n=1 Tax=Candidatus Nitrosacidococcus tergens TaxID=553981 RepID=A0A7G1Q9L2_9GAMM|nr:hypothetical protein [Candidatus Nitrosacidococcus tergens]CAB1275713.1 putative membrane protein [Candidatus Nitrosacidococcus tergens]
MGYANNYDFTRQSSCIGIWQFYPDKFKTESNRLYSVNTLIFDGDQRKQTCLKSIDNVFPWITTIFHTIGDRIDFREVSFYKVTFLLILLSSLLFIIKDGINRLIIAWLFFLVFSDLSNLLYINTLYTDFSVILGLFFALFSIIYLISVKKKEISLSLILLTLGSLIWLGLSKQQYMPLAVILGLIGNVTLFLKGYKKSCIGILLLSLILPLAYNQLNQPNSENMKSINLVNKTDTFLQTVLAAATNKKQVLAKLGLPQSCLEGVGVSWYGIEDPSHHPCSEVEYLNRFQIIGLFITDPKIFFIPMSKGIAGTYPYYPTYLGHLEFKDHNFQYTNKYGLLKTSSFSYVFSQAVPKQLLSLFTLFLMIASLTVCVLLVKSTAQNSYLTLLISMNSLGSFVMFYSVFSSVFGDGYIDLQKHGVGFLLGMAFNLTGLIFLLPYINDRKILLSR